MGTPNITATSEISTQHGIVQLCWRDEELFQVRIGPYTPTKRPATIRRYGPPHEIGRHLIAQVLSYFQGKPVDFDCPLPDKVGTDFQRRVWNALREIPYAHAKTYGELALRLGLCLTTARAVGAACGQNPLPILFPCHRVVAATGALTGFSAGVAWKKALLQLEGVAIQHDRIRIFKIH